jgi:hypothetical protein
MGRGDGAESANDILFGGGVQPRGREVEEAYSDVRAKRAEEAILWNSDGEDPSTDLADAIGNLHHWADRYGVNFDAAAARAHDYHATDIEEVTPPACRVEPYAQRGSTSGPFPEDKHISEHRADLSQKAIELCSDEAENDPETDLADVLSDFRHFADRYGLDFEDALERGGRIYDGDVFEEGRVGLAKFKGPAPDLDDKGNCSECGKDPAHCRCETRVNPPAESF